MYIIIMIHKKPEKIKKNTPIWIGTIRIYSIIEYFIFWLFVAVGQ